MTRPERIRPVSSLLRVALALACVLASCSASGFVTSQRDEFEQAVGRAEAILRGRVVAIASLSYAVRTDTAYCGTNYVVRVLETYRGRHTSIVSFAAYGSPLGYPKEIEEGDELLLLLREVSGNVDPFRQSVPDVILGEPPTAKVSCLARLSHNRLAGGYGRPAAFALENVTSPGSSQQSSWLLYFPGFTHMPADVGPDLAHDFCRGDGCSATTGRRISWKALEQRLREWCGLAALTAQPQPAPNASRLPLPWDGHPVLSPDWVNAFIVMCNKTEKLFENCDLAREFAVSIVKNAKSGEDSWPFRLEYELSDYLRSVAKENTLASTRVICSERGCLAYLTGDRRYVFDPESGAGGSTQMSRFLARLHAQPWMEEFEPALNSKSLRLMRVVTTAFPHEDWSILLIFKRRGQTAPD